MPIVFAAVVPHSPLLIPEVSKEHQRLVDVTRRSLQELAQEYYSAQPDVLIILTPHGPVIPGSFVIQQSETLTGRLRDFGDIQTRFQAPGAIQIAHQLKELAEDREIAVALQTAHEVDYGVTIPAIFFSEGKRRVPLLALSMSDQTPTEVIRLGQTIYEFIQSRNFRVAIIASADLTRRAKRDPSGTLSRPTAEEKRLAEAISAVDPARLEPGSHQSDTCGRNPILTLLSCLQPIRSHGSIRSFEAPFGVGLMTASFNLHT